MIVALYARVSTTKQAEKDLSIPDQLRQLKEWCTRQGHTVAAEYVEPGASALDDRRPVFQQMIEEACRVPRPFDAIMVHSQSRFFRDMVEYALYERRLNRAGVQVVSITQPTGDGFSGEMLRRMISLFDEYQSRENGKHTLRAMKENARQGYFNGARPPFGYRVEAVEGIGRHGAKKRLTIDPAEASVVRKVFELYLHGENGRELGLLGVVQVLNREGVTYRGKVWVKNRAETILANRAYIGELVFNRTCGKLGGRKPEEEWVLCRVPSIIETATFARTEERRLARQPSQVPARVVSSSAFLTGLLTCGPCGAGMTLATGNGGRYRYYKCGTRIRQGAGCTTRSFPVAKLDTAVRRALCDRVFTVKRVRRMLEELRKRLEQSRGGSGAQARKLRGDLEQNQLASRRLFEAVERGLIPMDDSLAKRSRELQARRQAILLEIAGLERDQQLPTELLSPAKVEAFCAALRAKMLDASSDFGKRYLRLLVEEIRVEGDAVVMRGTYRGLAQALATKKMGTSAEVPRFGPRWLPGQDSNLQPSG